jgi:hypothetical protein
MQRFVHMDGERIARVDGMSKLLDSNDLGSGTSSHPYECAEPALLDRHRLAYAQVVLSLRLFI